MVAFTLIPGHLGNVGLNREAPSSPVRGFFFAQRALAKSKSKVGQAMVSTVRRDLDARDLEIMESAIDGISDAITDDTTSVELESDEELEAALRRELMEIAYSNGVSDHEALRDIIFG